MFKLFHSIFGAGDVSDGIPSSLVDAAVERAVDGTDARLRALGDYRKRLRAPALRAIEHVVALVDGLPAPRAVSGPSYQNDAQLRAMFASQERMLEVLVKDPALQAARSQATPAGAPLFALLLAQVNEKRVLGMDLENEMLKRDVQQTVLSFDAHRLVDPMTSEDDTRRALKRRAFDHILMQALDQICTRRQSRKELGGQRALLRRKLGALDGAQWAFAAAGGEPRSAAELERELAEIEAQLQDLGPDSAGLAEQLEVLVAALQAPERHIWVEPRSLLLDHRNVMRTEAGAGVQELAFSQLCNSRGERVAALLIEIEPGSLPVREDFFSAAERYLR